jgi:hypothetical protein
MMKSIFKSAICKFLIAATAILPFQMAQASMIPVADVLSQTTVAADRNTVTTFMLRGESIRQLQSMGLDPLSANARIAAMSDAEIHTLAGQIQSAPAGADGGLALLILVIFFIWFFAFRR